MWKLPGRPCTGPSPGWPSENGKGRGGPSLVALFVAEREFLPGEDCGLDRRAAPPASGHTDSGTRGLRSRNVGDRRDRAPRIRFRAGRRLVHLVPLREKRVPAP